MQGGPRGTRGSGPGRSGRFPRNSDPGDSGSRSGRRSMPPSSPSDRSNPYRAYDPYSPYAPPTNAASARTARGQAGGAGGAGGMVPFTGSSQLPGAWNGGNGASGAGVTSAHLEAVTRKHHGFALFHDGNAGHLWRGEVASLFGDAILSVGALMWLAYLTSSPYSVLWGVLALGLPWLLAGPLAAPLQNVQEPGNALRWLGRLRALLALVLILMHFRTIYPVIYGLLFAIALCGRLREGLRVAATRSCLAPGEPELVANDLYVGSALVAVLGPLLAMTLFVLLGEHIILVSIGVAICYLLSSNSDGFLDALPESQRAFLTITPATAAPDERTREELLAVAKAHLAADADDTGDDTGDEMDAGARARLRELALPEWYQQGPRSIAQALGELRAGLGVAALRRDSMAAIYGLGALAFIGGGLATLDVFYVLARLQLPAFYLGPLLAAIGGGQALGGFFAASLQTTRNGRGALLGGLLLSGLALAALGYANSLTLALGMAFALGAANGVAALGGQRALLTGFDGVERRAATAGEAEITALASLLGAIFFTAAFAGTTQLTGSLHALAKLPFPGWPIGLVYFGTGAALALTAITLMFFPRKRKNEEAVAVTGGTTKRPAMDGTRARLEARLAEAAGMTGKSAAIPSAGGSLWGDAGAAAGDDGNGGDWGGEDESPSTYDSAYNPAYDSSYSSTYDSAYQSSYDPTARGGYNDYDDEADDPRYRSTRRPPRR